MSTEQRLLTERQMANEEALWEAVWTRDRRFDDRLLYGVRSTGVYCRPSCPSRRPGKAQVVFFRLPDAAERAGFRACQRCHPRIFEEAREKRLMDEELQVAAEIQSRLQPIAPPVAEGWDIIGASYPCREVGGDYYDFIPRRKGSAISIALGDVSGKGISAALSMSSLHAAVRAQSQVRDSSVLQVMREINNYIYESTPSNKFLTLFYAELDHSEAHLTYSNAAHPPPILLKASGEVVRLTTGGLPIGIRPEAVYDDERVSLAENDLLLIYSDGISEQESEEGEEFGDARLIEIMRQNSHSSAAQLRDRLTDELRRFSGTAPQTDDRSLVIIKRT